MCPPSMGPKYARRAAFCVTSMARGFTICVYFVSMLIYRIDSSSSTHSFVPTSISSSSLFERKVRKFYKRFAPREDPNESIRTYGPSKENELNVQLKARYGVDLHVIDLEQSDDSSPSHLRGKQINDSKRKSTPSLEEDTTESPSKILEEQEDDSILKEVEEDDDDDEGDVIVVEAPKRQIVRQILMSVLMFALLNCMVFALKFFFDVSAVDLCRRLCRQGRSNHPDDTKNNHDDDNVHIEDEPSERAPLLDEEGTSRRLGPKVRSFLRDVGVSESEVVDKLWETGFERWDSFQCVDREDLTFVGFRPGRIRLAIERLNRMATEGDAPYRKVAVRPVDAVTPSSARPTNASERYKTTDVSPPPAKTRKRKAKPVSRGVGSVQTRRRRRDDDEDDDRNRRRQEGRAKRAMRVVGRVYDNLFWF